MGSRTYNKNRDKKSTLTVSLTSLCLLCKTSYETNFWRRSAVYVRYLHKYLFLVYGCWSHLPRNSTRQLGQNSPDSTAGKVLLGQEGYDKTRLSGGSQDKTIRTICTIRTMKAEIGQPEQDWIVGTGQSGQECQNKVSGRDSQKRTACTGLPEQDNHKGQSHNFFWTSLYPFLYPCLLKFSTSASL
jgi:hypothetical protein